MMTSRQTMLVQATFEQSRVRGQIVGERFYRRLFVRYPEIRELFSGDIEDQAGKLIRMMSVLVDSLDRPAETADILFELGIRHQAYGVLPEHYHAAGRIFLWALKPADGNSFSPEIKQAWMAFYEMIVEQMIEAPRQVQQALA